VGGAALRRFLFCLGGTVPMVSAERSDGDRRSAAMGPCHCLKSNAPHVDPDVDPRDKSQAK
jgi:hypothetical protein